MEATTKQVTLIFSNLHVRGEANNPSNPLRNVEQLWTADGKLCFEKDPFNPDAWAMNELSKNLKLEAASPAHLVSIVTSQFHELQTLLRERDSMKPEPSTPETVEGGDQ